MPAAKTCSACTARLGLLTLLLGIATGEPALAQTAPARDIAADIARLLAVYPAFLDRVDGNVVVWKDGARMTIDAVLVDGAEGAGVLAVDADSSVTLDRAILRRVRAPVGSLAGAGMLVGEGGRLQALRVLVEDTEGAGALA